MTKTFYEHPEYTRRKPNWTKWRDLYEGEHGVITRSEYTWLHSLEEKTDAAAVKLRDRRMQRTRWNPIPEIVVSLLVSFAFRKPLELDDKTRNLLGREVDDIDGEGQSLDKFAQSCFEHLMISGKCSVLADSFGHVAVTKADEQALGLRPTLEIVEALQLVDWDIETSIPARLGRYNFARHEFEIVAPRADADVQPTIRRYTHVLKVVDKKYTIERYYVEVDANGGVLAKHVDKETKQTAWVPDGDPVKTQLDEVPLATIDDESWIKDVCEEALRYHNIRSNRDNIQYNQGYQRIFARGVNGADAAQYKNFAEYVVSFLPADGDAFALDPVPTADYDNAMNTSLDTALKIGLNLLRTLPTDSRAAQAADSIAAEKDAPLALLQAALTHVETLLRKSLNNYAAFKGQAGFDSQLVIPKDFTPEDWSEFITTANAFGDDLKSIPEVKHEILKKAVHRLRFGKDGEKKAMDALEASAKALAETERDEGDDGEEAEEPDPVAEALNG